MEKKIEEAVVEVLKNSDFDSTTPFQVRKSASEKLGLDLSERKEFVNTVIDTFIKEQQAKAEADEKGAGAEEQKEVEEEDDEGDLYSCRLSDKRRVTISEFKGRNLVSIREYYKKDGKELPGAKGISLTVEQWSIFSKNVPAIEKGIKKMERRLH